MASHETNVSLGGRCCGGITQTCLCKLPGVREGLLAAIAMYVAQGKHGSLGGVRCGGGSGVADCDAVGGCGCAYECVAATVVWLFLCATGWEKDPSLAG